jgi:hypothetical protein
LTTSSDGTTETLPRERLCQLAGVERGRHRRWQTEGLLARKRRYGEIDVIKAAALDELWGTLRPTAGKIVWPQIAGDLGIPGGSLDVVVRVADYEATIARSADELAAALPRGEPVVVVSLHARIEEARVRLRTFRTRASTSGAVSDPREVDVPAPPAELPRSMPI